jgi:hypothetical protein
MGVKKSQDFASKLLIEQTKMLDGPEIPVIEMRLSMEDELIKRRDTFLASEVKKHPGKSFWIEIAMWKDMKKETVVRQVIQARWTRPEPQPSTQVYYYNHRTDVLELKWTLPPPYSMSKILAMPQEYDQTLVKWVKEYARGDFSSFK